MDTEALCASSVDPTKNHPNRQRRWVQHQRCSFIRETTLTQWGRGCTACAQRRHSAHMTGRNWGLLLQQAIFLPIQTILHPHNVGQPDVSPHPGHKRCQCSQPQQRHMQKKARTKFVLNSKCERRTPLRLAYVQDMHHSTWRPHPQPPFGYVQPHGDTSCFAMGFLCCRLMRRTNQNYLHLQ